MMHGTTILAIRFNGKTAMAGDGQVTMGTTVMKHKARKVRKIFEDKVIAGFAGSVADAFTLFDKLEGKLKEAHGNLSKAAIEMVKEWRTDKVLRHLEALLIAADREHLLIISGSGEIIEPDDGIAAIGSGGPYALAAARALARHSGLTAGEIVKTAMQIASEICIYTNEQIVTEELN